MHGARDHLVELETGVAFLAVLFVNDVAALVVRAPILDKLVQILILGRFRQHVDHGARKPAEVEAVVGLKAGLGRVEIGLGVVLSGSVPVLAETV